MRDQAQRMSRVETVVRVLIYGVNARNKGAQLLLATAAERLLRMGHFPVVNIRDVDAQIRRDCRSDGIFAVERLGGLRSLGLDRLPRRFADRLPIAGDSQFDYVLDASGFSMTDSWGMQPISSRLSRLRRWRHRGIGFAMLPQAFGPFEKPGLNEAAGSVFDFAAHIWARDETSATYVSSSVGSAERISIAPDITIGMDAPPSSRGHRDVVLVPNWNIAKRSGTDGERLYVESMYRLVSALHKKGRSVTGLCHEGAADLRILEQVAERVGGIPVLSPKSGIECKRIIAGSQAVIAGRYHAVVSALSSGTPAIAHSWSHKYAALLQDFDVRDGLADPLNFEETLSKFEALDLPVESARLTEKGAEVKAKVAAVWDDVEQLLARHG